MTATATTTVTSEELPEETPVVTAPAAKTGKKKAEPKAEKPAATKATKKGAAKKAAEEKPAEAEEELPEEPSGLEATEVWKKRVLKAAPKDKAGAEKILAGVETARATIDTSRTKIGYGWLALRQNLQAGAVADKKTHTSTQNGFGLLGFSCEGDAAVSIGMADRIEEKEGDKIKVRYTLNVINQCVLLAKLDMQLLEAGVAEGIQSIDEVAQGYLARSSQAAIDEMVDEIATGTTDTDAIKARLAEIKAKSQPVRSTPAKAKTEAVVSNAKRFLKRALGTLDRVKPILKGAFAWAAEAEGDKRKAQVHDGDLAEIQKEALKVAQALKDLMLIAGYDVGEIG